jgi:MFS transporter, SP family, inositol transporter
MTAAEHARTSSDTPVDNDADVTREQWKWSVLAGMASFLDAGSIVALGSTLAIWQD